MICTKSSLYEGLADILHLALCCFVKAPLEAPAESIGSVIAQHGRKQRCSLKPSSLSSEVQIAWNGPPDFHPAADSIVDEALKSYFDENTQDGSVRFYVYSTFRLMSSTISSYLKRRARVDY